MLADLAVFQKGIGIGSIQSCFIHIVRTCDDDGTFASQLLDGTRDNLLQLNTVEPHELGFKIQWIGKRTDQVHNGWNPHSLTSRTNKAHGRMHGLRKDKGQTNLVQGFRECLWRGCHVNAQRF